MLMETSSSLLLFDIPKHLIQESSILGERTELNLLLEVLVLSFLFSLFLFVLSKWHVWTERDNQPRQNKCCRRPKCWDRSSAGITEPNPSSTASFRSDFSRKSWHQHHRAAQPGSHCFISEETHVSEGYCTIYIHIYIYILTFHCSCRSYSLLSSLVVTVMSSVASELLYTIGFTSILCVPAHQLPIGELKVIQKPRGDPVVLPHIAQYFWCAGPANGMKPCRRKLGVTDILGYFSTTLFHYLKPNLNPLVTIFPHFPSGNTAALLLPVCCRHSQSVNLPQLEQLSLCCSANGVKWCTTSWCQVASKEIGLSKIPSCLMNTLRTICFPVVTL